MAREATRRGGQRASDRIGLLERIGERLASSLELDVTLRQVAETLVPQFADHCFIDLLQGDALIRRAQLHSRGWMPEPGTWALVGEPIKYPEGPLLRPGHVPAGHGRGRGPRRGGVPGADRQRACRRATTSG